MVANQGEADHDEDRGKRNEDHDVPGGTKPWAPGGRITSHGHRIVLDDAESYNLRRATGERLKLQKKGIVFIMKRNVAPPEEKTGDARVLGVPRQEE